ncbi:hypothetical protein E0H93_36550 [Rhizobium leguminosarum bv. viciae]|uniref:hypothetical protein n=1 Tax=Rhizobium leguminosarum TaxID=384 RepID=UPI00103D2A25|nr:hypothetical protein [Rhizobium leguminosarum]TBY18517.1 hypothetical protein E0H55_37035 [Rhizobium leguminosarum bv. viciae]TCA92995.1 hypothetical protein E0H93_36550 [Rhizobium leguminosarum bv. viciae]
MSSRAGKRNTTYQKFLLSYGELLITKFSVRSMWFDDIWYFENGIPGSSLSPLNWRLDCTDVRWKSREWQRLLGDARRFLSSLQYKNMAGSPASDSTLATIGARLRFLMHWMISEGYLKFSDLTPGAFREFRDYTLSVLLDDDYGSRTLETVASYLDIPRRVFKQSVLFEAFPSLVLERDPLQGVSAHAICREFKISKAKRIRPVPDEIATPAINQALEWVDNRATDIINAVELNHFLYRKASHWNSNNYTPFINRNLAGFRFDGGGTTIDWRPSLVMSLPVTITDECGPRVVQQTPLAQLSDLFEDLVGACSIVIHALVGFRSSEGAGLVAYPLRPDGLPNCVVIRPSKIGLNEIIAIRGRVKKGRKDFEEAEWIAGARPVGSNYLPPPVRALAVLTRLFSHWRKCSKLDDLYLSVKAGGGLVRNPGKIARVSSWTLIKYENNFIQRHADIPDRFRSWRVNRAQWRKKFSHDLIKSDPKALQSIRLHFQQLSENLIESAYYGNNAAQLKLAEDEALYQSASDMAEIVFGAKAYNGPVVNGLMAQLRKLTANAADTSEAIGIITEELANEGLRTWAGPYGDCFFRWESALCHLEANGGLLDRYADRPNSERRCVDTCRRCGNFVVSHRHRAFWMARYAEAQLSIRVLRRERETILAEAMHQRAVFAKRILLAIGETEISLQAATGMTTGMVHV